VISRFCDGAHLQQQTQLAFIANAKNDLIFCGFVASVNDMPSISKK
jgi:hypothetical protein